MRSFSVWLAIFALGCSSPDDPDDPKNTDPDGVDTLVVDSDAHTDATDTDTGELAVSTFTEGAFRVTRIWVAGPDEGHDWNGDGDSDNIIPSLLALIGFPAATVDASLELMLSSGQTAIVFDAEHADPVLTIAALVGWEDGQGLHVLPDSFDDQGDPKEVLTGTFAVPPAFSVGPDALSLPMALDEDIPPLTLVGKQAIIEGDLDESLLLGKIHAVALVDHILADLVQPLLDDNITDLSERETYMNLATTTLEALADVETPDGPGASLTFHVRAEPVDL